MPASHKASFISTAEWNQFGIAMNSRIKGGPTNPALSALIVQSLLHRWKNSSRNEDRHLVRMIEWIAEVEDYINSHDGDVWKELNKADNGAFGSALRVLVFSQPQSKVPQHDSLVIRIQHDCLCRIMKDRSLPKGTLRWEVWLKTHWKEIEGLLRGSPCACVYRKPDGTPPDISGCRTERELSLCLLAHLHCSSSDAIAQDMKPSRRKPRSQKLSIPSRESS